MYNGDYTIMDTLVSISPSTYVFSIGFTLSLFGVGGLAISAFEVYHNYTSLAGYGNLRSRKTKSGLFCLYEPRSEFEI